MSTAPPPALDSRRLAEILGSDVASPESIPFSIGDVTAGSETELQAAVAGSASTVDLPLSIRSSNYFKNVVYRAAVGDTSPRSISRLERYLEENRDGIWENSWVRVPLASLGPYAAFVLDRDLRADKSDPASAYRGDVSRFRYVQNGCDFLRVPISYLVKLALADAMDSPRALPAAIRDTGVRVMDHFLNDNTSPETYSLHVVSVRPSTGNGRALARETAKRFLLTQLLVTTRTKNFSSDRAGKRRSSFSRHIHQSDKNN